DDGDFYIDADVDTIEPANMLAFMTDMDDVPVVDNDHQEPHPPANLNAYVDDGTIVAESETGPKSKNSVYKKGFEHARTGKKKDSMYSNYPQYHTGYEDGKQQ